MIAPVDGGWDVIVVGGGPAGSAAALCCAERGLRTLLLERDARPRPRACGEGILPHGVEWLESRGLRPPGRTFRGVRYVFPEGLELAGRFPRGRGLGVARRELDAYLLEAAARAGAAVRRRSTVTWWRPGGVRVEGGWLAAGVIIGADGRRSRLRRWAGLEAPGLGRPRYGVTAHFALARPESHQEVRIYVGRDHEVYTTPLPDGRLLVALLAEKGRMARLGGRLEAGYREALGEHPALEARLAERLDAPLAAGPLSVRVRRPWGPRLLLVGDAAGFLDPITGEGLALAMAQAELAAGAAAGHLAGEAWALPRYAGAAARLRREVGLLTAALLWLVRRPRLARWTARGLRRRPELVSRLLGLAAPGTGG